MDPKHPDKARRIETLAVLALACLVFALLAHRRHGVSLREDAWLVAAAAFLVIGCFVAPLAGLITRAWFGLSHALGAVMSRVVMGVVFFAVLLPLSLLRRLFEADPLRLRRKASGSYYTDVSKAYCSRDLRHPW